MAKRKIILADRLYVPTERLEGHEFAQFEYVFDPKKRRIVKGKVASRVDESVDEDDQPIEVIRTYDLRESDDYAIFPRGDLHKLEMLFGHLPWLDLRATAPLKVDLQFKRKLYPDQKRASRDWLRAGYGILKADTGWGKNFVLSYLMAKLGQRALVFGDNKSLVDQIYEEFRENTNISELEEEAGEPLIGTIHESKITKFFEVATFTTYQTFIERWAKNIKALRRNRDSFGLVWLNECHITPAPEISKIFQFLNAQYRGGDTATPERKDGKELVTFDLVGPVTADGFQDSETCECHMVYTGCSIQRNIRSWSTILARVTENRDRDDIIVSKVSESVDKGNTVLILTDRRGHAEKLHRLLTIAGYDFGLHYGQNAKKNNEVRRAAKDGELNGIVAVSKTTEKGFNVPCLNELHITCPMNNAPNLKQRLGRIRRVWLVCSKCEQGHSKKVSKCSKCGNTELLTKKRRAFYYIDADNEIVFKCGMGTMAAMKKMGFDVISDYSNAPEQNKKQGGNSYGLKKFSRFD